jgi:methionyl-tRNA synthetase
MTGVDYGPSVICRRCERFVAPRDVVEGTLGDNRTGVCEECERG